MDLEEYLSAGVCISTDEKGRRSRYIGVIEEVDEEHVALWSGGKAYSIRRESIKDVQVLEEG
jgi:ribosome maturation factor RimP